MKVDGASTTSQHVLEALRRAIVEGELRAGQRAAQEQIAGELGVSIGPVREALRTLAEEGQLTYLPRRGYFVTVLHIEDLEEIYELRRLLEERAARSSVPQLTEADLQAIRRAAIDCTEAVRRADVAGDLAANRRFHFAVFAGARQPHTMRLIQQLWDATEAYRALYYDAPQERLRALAAHDEIIEALDRRDADSLVAALDAHRAAAVEALRLILEKHPAREATAVPDDGPALRSPPARGPRHRGG